MTRLTPEQAAKKSALNRGARGLVPGEVGKVFGTLTQRPTYSVTKFENGFPPRVATRRYDLPFPPTVNTYWRNLPKGRTVLSEQARAYRKAIIAIATAKKPLLTRLKVVVDLYPPDKRRRDADNYVKAIFDCLQHAGVYADDEQIDEFSVKKHPPVRGGKCSVSIFEI